MKKINIKKVLVVCTLLGLIGAGVGWYLINQKLTPSEEYVKNCHQARRIYEQMVEFEKDYLSLPCAENLQDDPEMATLDISTSNGYLAQLVIASAMDSERLFFIADSSACSGDGPDNVVTPRDKVLQAGENGWAYFKGRELGSDKPLPLLVPGWNPATKKWDDPIWKNGIPVLMTDGSVVLYEAPSDGEIENFKTTKSTLPFDFADPDLVQPASKK